MIAVRATFALRDRATGRAIVTVHPPTVRAVTADVGLLLAHAHARRLLAGARPAADLEDLEAVRVLVDLTPTRTR